MPQQTCCFFSLVLQRCFGSLCSLNWQVKISQAAPRSFSRRNNSPLSFSLSGFKPNFIQYFLSLHSGKEWMCLSTCFPAIIHCNEIHTDYVLIKSPLEDTVWILNKTLCQFALCSSKSILHSTTIWISRKKVREFLMLVAEGAGNPNHVSDHLCNISQSVLSSIYNKYTHNTDTKEQVGVQGSCFSPSQLLQR